MGENRVSRIADVMTVFYFGAMAVLGAIPQAPTAVADKLPTFITQALPQVSSVAFLCLLIGVFSWAAEKIFGPKISISIGIVGVIFILGIFIHIWASLTAILVFVALFMTRSYWMSREWQQSRHGQYAKKQPAPIPSDAVEQKTPSETSKLDIGNKKRAAAFYRSTVEAAFTDAQRVLTRIVDVLRSRGEIEGALGNLINNHILETTLNAYAAINNAFTIEGSPGYGDLKVLQELFGVYYEKYQGVRTWILQAGDFVGFPYGTDVQYQQWIGKDSRFLEKLGEVTAEDGFEVLRNKVAAVGQGVILRKKNLQVPSSLYNTITSPAELDKVPYLINVTGKACVQLFVLSGDNRWYPQIASELKWSMPCRIGDENSPRRDLYEMVAIVGGESFAKSGTDR